MKKILICMLIFSLFIFSGCSNSELENLEIDIKEQNLKIETIYSSYELSKNNIKTVGDSFVKDLCNFTNNELKEYEELENYSNIEGLDTQSFSIRAKLLQQARKEVKIGICSDVSEVEKKVNENLENYILLDDKTGNVFNVIYFKFPSGVKFEYSSMWSDGIITEISLRKVGE